MDLSIIIVNWNSKEYLRACISSIKAFTAGIRYEVIVIDSASYDGAGEMLAESHVRFIQSDRNLGFARANNRAVLASTGRYLLFLNPDTELAGPAVNILYDHLRRLPRAGAVGCRLLNGDGSIQTSCIQSFPTVLNQLLNAEFLRRLTPRSPLWGMAPLFAGTGPSEADVLSGACIMMPRNVFEQVGSFSEEYFLYAEDLDLCYKVRKAGYANYLVPGATIVHFGGGSSEKRATTFPAVMMRASVWRFLKKTRGAGYGLIYRTSTMIAACLRLALLSALSPLYLARKRTDAWRAAAGKWGAILVWSIGLQAAAARPGRDGMAPRGGSPGRWGI
jgi:GT2 family glycosyltransferase